MKTLKQAEAEAAAARKPTPRVADRGRVDVSLLHRGTRGMSERTAIEAAWGTAGTYLEKSRG